ncbi:hypothetical protein DFJ73DRAFT_851522 [Zopfochytrium polystomum]|nr:hypothetical protein DFJ73DRAFT_851522 [Zopfochytrium polystomum]
MHLPTSRRTLLAGAPSPRSPQRRLLRALVCIQALLALACALGLGFGEVGGVSAVPMGRISLVEQDPAAPVHRRDFEADEVDDGQALAQAIYRRGKTANQKAKTATRVADRKANAGTRAAANKAAGLEKQKAAKASPDALKKQRADRSKQTADRKKAAKNAGPGGAKAVRKAEHTQRLKAKTAHRAAAATLQADIAKDPTVKGKWKNFKDHVVPFDASKPTYGGHHYDPSAVKAVNSAPYSIKSATAKSGTAQIEFDGPHKDPKKAAKGKTQTFKKSVFLAPGDHTKEHPNLPNLSQKDGYSKKQVKSAALQAFVQGRAGATNDATVEVSGKGSVPMKVFASGGGPGTTYPDTTKIT